MVGKSFTELGKEGGVRDLRWIYKPITRMPTVAGLIFYGYNEGFRDIVLETIDRGGGDCLMWV